MKRVIVRYKVKPGRAEENEADVRKVYEELRRAKPAGLRYATFRLADGVSFVHIAEHGDPNPLREIAAFKAFGAAVGARCEEPPFATEMTEVGSYHFFES
ncbi:MAG: hypothetical protein ACREVQ_02240 [Burkholderiales bacterium]